MRHAYIENSRASSAYQNCTKCPSSIIMGGSSYSSRGPAKRKVPVDVMGPISCIITCDARCARPELLC
jgi:hypothetical protein